MDCYYVDKTDHARRLVERGKYYFLSRPRRFGKTLLVDTLQKLFEGSEELFRGLAVHGKWDWSARHPVVRLDFGGGDFGDLDGVREEAEAQLKAAERLAGIEPGSARVSIRFRELIEALHERTGQRAVVLVDEYDKPISWTRSATRNWRGPTATSCVACTGRSRPATSGSVSFS